jgi:hypothetical protein
MYKPWNEMDGRDRAEWAGTAFVLMPVTGMMFLALGPVLFGMACASTAVRLIGGGKPQPEPLTVLRGGK